MQKEKKKIECKKVIWAILVIPCLVCCGLLYWLYTMLIAKGATSYDSFLFILTALTPLLVFFIITYPFREKILTFSTKYNKGITIFLLIWFLVILVLNYTGHFPPLMANLGNK